MILTVVHKNTYYFSSCSGKNYQRWIQTNICDNWIVALEEIAFMLLISIISWKCTEYLLSLLLGFDTSILPICKDSLGWMFNRLDTNYDLLLDQSELGSIYLDKNEQCTKAFFNSCDTYKDSLISNNEWCYCFQRQQGKTMVPVNLFPNLIYPFMIKNIHSIH